MNFAVIGADKTLEQLNERTLRAARAVEKRRNGGGA
jgi:hypothetical protein